MSENSEKIIRGGALYVPLEAIESAVSRSSGPGGQNVNKQNTRIEIRVQVSAITGGTPEMHRRLRMLAGKKVSSADELRLVCQQTRSLEQNREAILQQLSELFAEASNIPRRRRPTKPTRGSKRRRIENKKLRGETKRLRSGDE